MFSVIRSEISDRILSANSFWNYSIQSAGTLGDGKSFSKGIIFVHLYAIYEYSIVNSFRAVIAAIKIGQNIFSTLKREPLSILINADWESIINTGRKSTWAKRISVLKKIDSHLLPEVDDTIFPTDGTHFRQGQLHTIWNLLDISTPIIPDNRILGRIEELVEYRNAIAHGRKKPEEIGRMFTEAEIEVRINDTERICLHIVNVLDNYVINKGYLI